MEWPPKELIPIRQRLAEWDAWLTGDRARLEQAGQAHGGSSYHSDGATEKRFGAGPIGRLVRRFWGRTDAKTEPKVKVHVPLAADIARASSDLLFAEPPSITATTPEKPDEPTARDGMCVLMNAVLPSKSTGTEETGPPPIRGVAR